MKIKTKLRAAFVAFVGVVVACAAQRDTSTVESEEIGVCGANADPVTGVVCNYYSQQWGGELSTGSIVEINGLDYAHCTWTTHCQITAYAVGSNGNPCVSVIGTGCMGGQGDATYTNDVQLPVGWTGNDVTQYCKDHPGGYWLAQQACDNAYKGSADQGEDLCCQPRAGSGSGSGSGR